MEFPAASDQRRIDEGAEDVDWREQLTVAKDRDIVATRLVRIPIIDCIGSRDVYRLVEPWTLQIPLAAEGFIESLPRLSGGDVFENDGTTPVRDVEGQRLTGVRQAWADEGEPRSEVCVVPVALRDDDLKENPLWAAQREGVDIDIGRRLPGLKPYPGIDCDGLFDGSSDTERVCLRDVFSFDIRNVSHDRRDAYQNKDEHQE
jgi:hypothetical protein